MELFIIIAVLLFSAVVCLLVKQRQIIEIISVLSSGVVLVTSLLVASNVANHGTYAPFPIFFVDALGAIVMLIIATVGLAASFYSVFYLREETKKMIIGFRRVKQYFILLNLFLAAMFFAIMVNSPILMWISIEATTLSTAFLISFYNKPSSMEAAWKYLIINSVGLLLAFFGTLLFLTSVRTIGADGFVSWDVLMAHAGNFDVHVMKIAFIFVLIGYGTKVGLFPMHTWLPDAHSKAPVPVSALLSGVLLNVALVAVLRFKLITDTFSGPGFAGRLLLLFGMASIVAAALIIFTQKNYKRLLAYSSIENIGIITLGFGIGGLGAFAALLHMIYHALIKSSLFFSAGNLFLKYSSTKISNIRGAIVAVPFTATLFLMGFLAITGIPPFGLFLTKLYILSALIEKHPYAVLIALASFIVLFIGFLKHGAAMVFGEKPTEVTAGETNRWLVVSPLVLIIITLYLSIYIPPFLYTLITSAVATYSS